jgi:hypothetical protein
MRWPALTAQRDYPRTPSQLRSAAGRTSGTSPTRRVRTRAQLEAGINPIRAMKSPPVRRGLLEVAHLPEVRREQVGVAIDTLTTEIAAGFGGVEESDLMGGP